MRNFFIPFLFLMPFQLSGQQIRILDRSDLQPVEHVMIFNKSNSAVAFTNRNGEAFLTQTTATDTLIFQHASYQDLSLAFDKIEKNNMQVFLSIRSYDLQQLIVTANRWEQSREDVTTQITSIPSREASFQNPQTSADLLGKSNKVFVQKSQLGGGSPMLRGFAANSVLLVVEGVRMNNAIYRSGNLQNVISLDPNLIENTEIVFGPGSVIYGSDALGGVMIFNTWLPRIDHADTLSVTAKPMVRYSSANNEKTGHLSIQATKAKWGFTTSFTFSDFGDLRTGSKRSSTYPDYGKRHEYVVSTGPGDSIALNPNPDVMKPSGYKQWNIAQKIRFQPSRSLDLTYGFHYSETSDIPRYDRLIEYRNNRLRFAEWYYGPQRWMMHNLQVRLLGSNAMYDGGKITLAYQFNEESRHSRQFNASNLISGNEKVHAWIINADFEKSFPSSATLYYGLEGLYNNVISVASSRNIVTNVISAASTRYPDGGNHYGSLAAYGFLKKKTSEKLVFNAGLRFSRVMLKSQLNDTVFYHFPFNEISLNTGFMNGSAGLAFHPAKSLQLNINLATGFRAPNLDDAGKIFESEPGRVVVPNPDLKPEYVANSEFGLIYTGTNGFRVECNLYYSLLFDVMVRRDFVYQGRDSIMYNNELSKVQAIVNAGMGEIAGFFIGASFNLNKYFSLKSSFTGTAGREMTDAGSIPLKHIPPLFGATSIHYTGLRTRLELSAVYNAAKPFDQLDPSEQAKTHIYTPEGSLAWYTLNFKASFQVVKGLQLNAGIENLFDRHYWPYASGIPAPGRNIYIAFRGNL